MVYCTTDVLLLRTVVHYCIELYGCSVLLILQLSSTVVYQVRYYWCMYYYTRGWNGGQNVQKTSPVYSIKPFKTKGTIFFEKKLPPPYLLGFRLH